MVEGRRGEESKGGKQRKVDSSIKQNSHIDFFMFIDVKVRKDKEWSYITEQHQQFL